MVVVALGCAPTGVGKKFNYQRHPETQKKNGSFFGSFFNFCCWESSGIVLGLWDCTSSSLTFGFVGKK